MRTSFTVLLFILCSKVLLAQNKDSLFIDQLQDKLFERALKTEENFHIITDRPWYFPGEEIWFKVYITTNGLPVTGSGVLYVSLTDTSGQILIKKILPVEDDGASYGNLKIPAGLTKGWYSLGVQTEWGRNFNDGTEKIIYVNEQGGIPEKLLLPIESPAREKTVHFFPEGGNFVAGLQNRFGVKAIQKDGIPAIVKGYLIGVEKKDTLAFFETSIDGLGEFVVGPINQEKIVAVINWPDGSTATNDFLPVLHAGTTLQISTVKEKLFYKIESLPLFYSHSDKSLLVAIMYNEIVYTKWFYNPTDLNSYSGYIPLDQFPGGIIHLGLYNSDGKEMARRDVYHYINKTDLVSEKQISFEPQSRNEIGITLADTMRGTYSVSITDADLTGELVEQNNGSVNYSDPFSGMTWLTKKGKRSNLYLLTRNEISSDSNPNLKFSYQRGVTVSGKLVFDKTDRPVSNKMINFFPKNSGFDGFLLSDSLDSNGNFKLKNLFVEDSTQLSWNINGMNVNELNKIKLKPYDNWFDSMTSRSTILQRKTMISAKKTIVPTMQETIKKYFTIDSLEYKKVKTLPEVNIIAQQRKRIEELDKTYANTSLFGGRLGEAFTFDIEEEKTYYPNIFSYLQGRVPSLKISGSPNNPSLIYRSGDLFTGGPNVIVFVNENPIAESSDIASIPVSEIAYVKAFKPPLSYILTSSGMSPTSSSGGSRSSGINNGRTPTRGGSLYNPGAPKIDLVIAIYLRKTESKINTGSPSRTFQSFPVKGFSLPANFPLTDHSQKNESENIPDKRITLYWNPDIQFTNGKANIVFYNNDFTKRYLVKIEGINEWGEIISYQKIIER